MQSGKGIVLFKFILSEAWPYLATVAGIIAGLFYALQSGKRQGRAQVEREHADAISEKRRKTNVVDSEMAGMDDDDVRSELASWVRDDGD